MPFVKETRNIIAGVLIAFFIVGISAGYWAIVGADSILQRSDNPRLVVQEARILRGTIYDTHETVLAQTNALESGALRRTYPVEATFGTMGYFSLRYGVGGLEAAYNDILRGDTLPQSTERFFNTEILHQPIVGIDIRLTLDASLQAILVQAMDARRGAIIVSRVRDGAVISMISQPMFDPNTLDNDWDSLRDNPDNPFFNRVTQGQYQPGGILQTPLMVASLLTQVNVDTITADASVALTIDDVTLDCAITPMNMDLSLAEAYMYGCSRPFSLLLTRLAPSTLQPLLDAFALDVLPRGVDFLVDNTGTQNSTTEAEATDEVPSMTQDDFIKDWLGQGATTVNPLAVNMMVSAIVNDGSALTPYLLEATRAPQEDWVSLSQQQQVRAIMTDTVARRLRDLWRNNFEATLAEQLNSDGAFMAGGHHARADGGEQELAWFNGFLTQDNGEAYAITIILEDSQPTEASQIALIAMGYLLDS
jgi:peptidoglycan glycosyltransferase